MGNGSQAWERHFTFDEGYCEVVLKSDAHQVVSSLFLGGELLGETTIYAVGRPGYVQDVTSDVWNGDNYDVYWVSNEDPKKALVFLDMSLCAALVDGMIPGLSSFAIEHTPGASLLTFKLDLRKER